MPESLQARLTELRQRLRQMTWLYGLSWLVAVVLSATLCAGLLDWSVRLDDAGVRFLLALGILAAGGWICWRLLVRPLRREISDVEIALRIEQRYPGFNDSLASTVQFLEAGRDPKLGSPAMQQQVVERTIRQVERVNLSDIVETRRVRKVAWAAFGVCLITALVAGFNQAAAGTALHRLMFPFANRPWPKTTELRLLDEKLEALMYDSSQPLKLAEGDTLEVYVENIKGKLPDEVFMEYTFDEEEVIREPLRRVTLPGSAGKPAEFCVATIMAAKGPIKFRAVGGDDFEMQPLTLEVVPPPEVESLQVILTPPKYTQQNQESLPKGAGHVRGLVGTMVHVKAAVNKPLKSAHLRVKELPPIAVQLSEDQQKLEVEFTIAEAGVYAWWFDLEDQEGFTNPNAPRYEVRGMADLVPEVWIDEPARDKNVTPAALVPLVVRAKDDLGLKAIRLQYKISSDPNSQPVLIPLDSPMDRPLEHRLEYAWELANLNLTPGMEITFHAEALDDHDLEGEHIGKSTPRKLTIVSPEEKSSELAVQQGGLIEELETAHKMQTQTHDQVELLKIQLQAAGQLRPDDVDLLKRLEIEQRQISSRLSHPTQGLLAHTEELLEELKHNKIDDAEMQQRLNGMANEVNILQEDHLPLVEQELTNARKLAQTKLGLTPEDGKEQNPKPAPDKAKDQQTALDRVDGHQEAVLDSLGEMLAQLSEWRHHQDITGEVRDLIGNQTAINRDTAEVGQRTFGKRPQDLSPQEKADLARLADRQRKQAQRVGDLGKSVEDVNEQLKETSPEAAEILTDAEAHLKEQAVAGKLQEAANQITGNQIGEAAAGQNEALANLNELSDILKNRSVSDTETLVKKLKEARSELETLKKRQEELIKKTDEAEKLANPQDREQHLEKLRQEQAQLRREVSSLARRLRRLEAQDSGSSLRRAANRMEEAEQLLQENQTDRAEDNLQDVLEDLEQAERELAQEEQAAQEKLAREMLERIADELKSMIAREQAVIDETNRLEALKRETGRWSRAQLKSLRDLAENQRNLKTETDRLTEIVKAAEVFALALQGASRDMERAAKRLDELLTDGETIRHETAAKNRFVDLIAALDEEKDKAPNENPAANGGEGGQTNAGPQSDGIPHLAQLKMLKTLQEDLIRRTEDLDRVRQESGELSPDQTLELDLLAGEQGLLADLTRNLTAQFADAFSTEPEEPPKPEPAKPEKQPEPAQPEKRPSLEEELNRELDLNPQPSKDQKAPQADRLRSERISRQEVLLAYAGQVELDDVPLKEEPAKTPPADQPETTRPKADEELLQGLVGKDPTPGDPTKNPLEEAVSGMRSAQERIQGKDTGKDTRKIQENVVANLQKLIDLAKQNQNRPPSPMSNSQEPMENQQQPMQQSPMPQETQQDHNTTETQQQQTTQERENAQDSSDEERQSQNAKANFSRNPEMLNDAWGHLPPSVRHRLLMLSGDKYLPKYEDLARRYFEALAEPARNSSMKTP